MTRLQVIITAQMIVSTKVISHVRKVPFTMILNFPLVGIQYFHKTVLFFRPKFSFLNNLSYNSGCAVGDLIDNYRCMDRITPRKLSGGAIRQKANSARQ